jgi:LPXTG-site transpeptidase (sortase) family protein
MTMTAPVEKPEVAVADDDGHVVNDGTDVFERVAPAVAPARPQRPTNVPLLIVGSSLCILAALLLSLVAELTVVGSLKHNRDQQVDYASLRKALAEGVAPTGQTDIDGRVLAPGTPVALLSIPKAGISQEVVAEGTTSSLLMSGPGHRRDTVLPGQPGTSVIMGRQAAYGGPFSGLRLLKVGDELTVTTGQGVFTYKVSGLRGPGSPVPAPEAGQSRLTLVTADGLPYLASSTLRIDATLTGDPVEKPAPVLSVRSLAPSELAMQGETAAWIPLAFWAQGLVVAAIGAVFLAARWGRWQTWIVGVPVLLLLGLGVSEQVARLLPNLI